MKIQPIPIFSVWAESCIRHNADGAWHLLWHRGALHTYEYYCPDFWCA